MKLSIRDEGVGISREHLSRVFDPYFTTKHKGSGLGLAVCHSIVKGHDGWITAQSELGAGATFLVYLPASLEQLAEQPAETPSPLVGRGKVLVMDDEEAICKLATRMLSRIGYEGEFVQEGAAAVETYARARESGQPFNAVILDLTVPGELGGKEVIQRLLELDPEVKAIVSSGYSNDPIMTAFRKHGFRGAIVKPFVLEELAKVLHQALAKAD